MRDARRVVSDQDVSVEELQAMARRQQKQIEAQQQMLVAKEQRLKYLRQQDFKQQQMGAEYERLRRLREKVEAQELKLRKLRALRGQQQQQEQPQQQQQSEMVLSDTAVLADLESIRSLFNEKEKELGSAVRKVEELTRQLDDLRSNNNQSNSHSSGQQQSIQHQVLELERLRRELAYRRQLNEQQNNMIAQQRAQLAMGRDEMIKIDNRIIELQERLARKRLMNQQLASKISAATSAKQAQLRAIQQGLISKPNKPVSTVEPFIHRQSNNSDENNEENIDKYQTLPFSKTKTNSNTNIEEMTKSKPVSSVAPVTKPSRPTQLLRENSASALVTKNNTGEGNSGNKPALPPKPTVMHTSKIVLNNTPNNQFGTQPPPYVPAPQPTDLTTVNVNASDAIETTTTLSVSMEQGTSVDDDEDMNDENDNTNAMRGVVNVSINRRIEMPPAFLFPEKPNSELIEQHKEESISVVSNMEGNENNNVSSYEMLTQLYTEFDHLTYDEQNRLLAASNQGLEAESVDELSSASSDQDEFIVPEVIEEDRSKQTKPIIKKLEKQPSNNNVRFDPLALLLDASLEGELELVEQTASLVPDASAANDEGITALHNAICAGHLDIVHFLVNFGCNVNAQDSDGWTPLHCAASCNNLPMAKFLVEHGACIYSTTFSDAETAAEKCEEDEEGFVGCSEFLYTIQDNLGLKEIVYAVFDFDAKLDDELSLRVNDALIVLRRGDDNEKLWWWVRKKSNSREGYVPRNHLGCTPRILPLHHRQEADNDNNNN